MSQLVWLVVIVGAVLVLGLLIAIATLLRRPKTFQRPTYSGKTPRHRLDIWTSEGR